MTGTPIAQVKSKRRKKSPVVDLKDGIQGLRMALAVKQPLATHQPVDLD